MFDLHKKFCFTDHVNFFSPQNILVIKLLLHLRVKMCKRMDQRSPWHRHIDIDLAFSFSLFLDPSSHQRSSSPSRGSSWSTEQSRWAQNSPMVSGVSITSILFVTSHSDSGGLDVSICYIYSHFFLSCKMLLFVELISQHWCVVNWPMQIPQVNLV